MILTMPKMFRVPAQGTLPYQYFTVDPGFTQDMWIRASEVALARRRSSITWW